MHTQKLMTTTILTSAALLASALLATSSASAAAPVKSSYETHRSGVVTGLAPFDIACDSVFQVTEIDHFDNSGALVRISIHFVEQDTFTANGKTLVSEPYTTNFEWGFDTGGNQVRFDATAIVCKVRLPNGSLFMSAGFIDWLNHPGGDFILTPDKGGCVNLEGFIEALSP